MRSLHARDDVVSLDSRLLTRFPRAYLREASVMSAHDSVVPTSSKADDAAYSWSIPIVKKPTSRRVFPSTHLFPVACWTCHFRTSAYWLQFRNRRYRGERAHDILDQLNIKRACCRCIFLTHVDMCTPRTTAGQIFM